MSTTSPPAGTNPVSTDAPLPAPARLRHIMNAGCVAMPGAFSALCARAIARAGFDACYVSGAATSVSAGVPDVGLLTLEHFCRVIREVADGASDAATRPFPVLADADTGFGEAELVRRTVIEYARAGAAGLHIEDQVFPKRCGHLDGKALVPMDHMIEKIEWASKAARDVSLARDPSSATERAQAPIICARTDARGVDGFAAAVQRARAYCAAGAEMIFPEGLQSEDEFARFVGELRSAVPSAFVLANMTEFGKTPMIPLSRFASMGYSCVIYPVTLLRVAMGAVTRALGELKATGTAAGLLEQMQTRAQLYDSVGYKPGVPWEFPVR
ncbi:MAG: isocitrate lyase/phosphoenolpyruvate mutase family protein [Planctomycetota bacterium]|nr:isocitrate lyase/phosphoenolpyruvate mutase family protein [Planctomycetota bacterium]